jgi:hypothetical protein
MRAEGDLSQLSHRLSGQRRTQAHNLDIRRILTCGSGLWRTDRTDGIDLRIRRLGCGGLEYPALLQDIDRPGDHEDSDD